ncbi:MAG: efflux RND transporter periplasmic adaptor subunit [Thermodesulfobacteriota bacterium]
MKKRVIRLVVLLLVLGGAGYGIWSWKQQKENGPKNELTLHGNTDMRQVELAFNDAERIEKILVDEGDRVKKGQLLASLSTARMESNLAAAEAQAEAQAQVVAALKAGSRPEEIARLAAQVDAARVSARNAADNYNRIAPLAKEDLAPRQQADDAKAARDAADAQLRALQQSLDLAVAGPRKEDIAAAEARLQALSAQRDLARRVLEDASLYAPSDGIIRNRVLEVGDMASPQRPVLTLALTDPIWVRAYVSEPDLGLIRPGMSAAVTTDSFPGKSYKARVGYVSPTAEFTPKWVEVPEVRTRLVYQVRVWVENPQGELRLGMPATVTVPLNQAVPASKAS